MRRGRLLPSAARPVLLAAKQPLETLSEETLSQEALAQEALS
ncbi:MAG: hypothetical protein SH859_09045 [Hyphomicrobium aestuarii]|nr:hypothetical protein [Hyphomicrobium aestuarii]